MRHNIQHYDTFCFAMDITVTYTITLLSTMIFNMQYRDAYCHYAMCLN